jgi:hypothetical protein
VKKIITAFFASVIICSSCSKNHTEIPANPKTFNVSFKLAVSAVVSSTWQQVLGGKASIAFTAKNADTLTVSSLTDSLDLSKVSTYNKPVIAGTYDVSLKTKSTAVADTFIRFNALAQNVVINKDVAINMPATTTDGVITISKKLIDSTTVPTFIPAGTNTTYNLGVANDYYFIYVAGSKGGKVTFTEASSGDLFIANVTVAANNQYNLTAIVTKTGSVVKHTYAFKSNNNLN